MNVVSLDSFKSKLHNAREDKIYVLIIFFLQNHAKIQHTIGLVVPANYTSWVSSEITFGAMPRIFIALI